tara:strand:+ start:4908 stop:5165 length:258 start_codon:yes stop_codon:yes gene_type:complete
VSGRNREDEHKKIIGQVSKLKTDFKTLSFMWTRTGIGAGNPRMMRLRGKKMRTVSWLDRIKRKHPNLFVHWSGHGAFAVEAMGAR